MSVAHELLPVLSETVDRVVNFESLVGFGGGVLVKYSDYGVAANVSDQLRPICFYVHLITVVFCFPFFECGPICGQVQDEAWPAVGHALVEEVLGINFTHFIRKWLDFIAHLLVVQGIFWGVKGRNFVF